jgi:signal transduction histidine kinase
MRNLLSDRSSLRLVLVFLGLVLLPSFLLGYFSLRAVEAEREARQRRLLEDYQRYADFAARTVRAELVGLESAWRDLVPARAGWEGRVPELAAALEPGVLRERFVRSVWLLDAAGVQLLPAPPADPALAARQAAQRAAPTPAEARRFEQLLARGEAAEFDTRDVAAAVAAYSDILTQVQSPRLRAIALAALGRAELQRGGWDAALEHYRTVLERYPEALDLDNQPLRFLAALQIARVLEEKRDPAAVAALLDLQEDLARRSDEIGSSQYAFFRERLDAQLDRLLAARPDAELAARRARLTALAKKPVGERFYVDKLARKLTRAVMDEQPWSPRLRYISDLEDGHPYLLAYLFMPDGGTALPSGLLGFEIELPRLSAALLPELLRELDLARDLRLVVLDEAGRPLIASEDGTSGQPVVSSSLGEPFEFWNVAVVSREPGHIERAVDFRTQVFLYLIVMLLLTIVAGAALVAIGIRRQARLANLKTTFVSNVSHELRTPLTSIRMYAEMLETSAGGPQDAERRRQLAVIRSECGRLERLIDAVLDFARLERGTRVFRFEYEEIGPLVRAAAEDFRQQAESQGFRYVVEIDEDLPEVRVDADALRQVLLNLLSNAVKYSDTERWIAVRAFARDGQVGVQVEDRGIGIDPAEHERIFEDFYRVDQRLSSDRQGVGLGLTLVRRIVEAHRGRVTVDSSPGHGARFTVWLPAEEPETPTLAAPDGRVTAET